MEGGIAMSDSDWTLDDPLPVKTTTPNVVERILKIAVLALSVVLVLELAWFLCILPTQPLRSVRIDGGQGMPRDSLAAAAGLSEKTSFLSFDPEAARRGLESLPEIASASVVRRFPDSVSIELERRECVAVALAVTDGATVLLSIDKQGVVFRIGSASDDGASAVPILSGLAFKNPRTGMRLPEFLHPLLSDIAQLYERSPVLLETLSEIRVEKKAYEAYELVLYPSYRPVRVRMGSRLNEDGLRYMMLLLDVLASKGIETDELDFRTGTAAYRVKEG